MEKFDLIIVGGGASGLMAAGHAAEEGLKVLVLEKMSHPGRKLSITGKGRCNLTNETEAQEFVDLVEPDGRFLLSAFSKFYNQDLIELFNRIGVPTKLERGGRYFPANDSAPDVTKRLVQWCLTKKVTFVNNFNVNRLIIAKNRSEDSAGFRIKAVQGTSGPEKWNRYSREGNVGDSQSYNADRVLICTGGLSYPATGSDGDGYRMLKQVGHTVNQCLPSLVPLTIDTGLTTALAGLELKNVRVDIKERGKLIATEFGELYFMESGLSGPTILTLSRKIVPLLHQQRSLAAVIDFKPALDEEKLDNRLIRDFTERGKEALSSILRGLLPMRLIPICLEQTHLKPDLLGALVTAQDRKKLLDFLKGFSIKINGYGPYSEAIVTKGGISVKEVNQKTMESKLVSGLFIAGELLDLDGPTGGYNLQIAFSTGWAAAEAAIQEVKSSDAGQP